MRTNALARNTLRTHEGAPAHAMNPMQALRRSVLSCLLFEREFYEDGQAIASRIQSLAAQVSPEKLAELAIEARTVHNVRHVSLLLTRELVRNARGNPIVAETIPQVIKRADEIAELLAIYWKDGKTPIAAQLKKGLAAAFANFDEYQLAKYDRDSVVKMRDVMRMVRPSPEKGDQEALFGRVISRTLATPDTWEVALSGGADKGATFTRLLQDKRLGYLALLRNLRNMVGAGVDTGLIKEALLDRRGASRVLPFRFVAAARACPQLEAALDQAMALSIEALPKLSGRTVVLVDVSGSMDAKLSQKSDLTRMDAAAALSSIVNADNLRVFSFSYRVVEVPPRRGMAGVDAVINSQSHGCTYLGQAIQTINTTVPHDRLIVVTDEQTADRVPNPVVEKAYMINVASARNGVGYGAWKHIDGFSENVLKFIHEIEQV